MRRLQLFLAVTLVSAPAYAFDPEMQMKGANFSDACTRTNESWISFCNGYIQATVDSLSVGDGVCIPNGATRTDLVTAVERTITASSQLKSINSFEAVRLAMRQAFPCS